MPEATWQLGWDVNLCACVLSHLSHVRLFVTLWTIDHQAPHSMGFSRQEYWSGLTRPLPGYLLDPEMEPMSLMSPALAYGFFTTSTTWEALAFEHRQQKFKLLIKSLYCPGWESGDTGGEKGDKHKSHMSLSTGSST